VTLSKGQTPIMYRNSPCKDVRALKREWVVPPERS